MNLDELLRHRRWLHRQATKLVHCPVKADDLVQDTYIAILGKPLPDVPARAWLRGVLHNVARSSARSDRRRSKREEAFFQIEDTTALSPDVAVARLQEERRVVDAIDGLPEPLREVLLLRYHEGYSSSEIARQQGIPAGTVRWRQKRGLEALRQSLERQPTTERGLRRVAPMLLVPFAELVRGAVYSLNAAASLFASPKLAGVPSLIALLFLAFMDCEAEWTDSGDIDPPLFSPGQGPLGLHPVPAVQPGVAPPAGPKPATASPDEHGPKKPEQSGPAAAREDTDEKESGPELPSWLAATPHVRDVLRCAGEVPNDPECQKIALMAIAGSQPICDPWQRLLVLMQLDTMARTGSVSSADRMLLAALGDSIAALSNAACAAPERTMIARSSPRRAAGDDPGLGSGNPPTGDGTPPPDDDNDDPAPDPCTEGHGTVAQAATVVTTIEDCDTDAPILIYRADMTCPAWRMPAAQCSNRSELTLQGTYPEAFPDPDNEFQLIPGQDYEVCPVTSLVSGIPRDAEVVIIESNSEGSLEAAMSQRSPAAQTHLAEFVESRGGTLVVHLAGNIPVEFGYLTPGLTDVRDDSSDSNIMRVVVVDHPFALGPDGEAGTDDDGNDSTIAWDVGVFAHQGTLDGILPAQATVLIAGADDKPVYAEYSLGKGRVIASTLTFEFGTDYNISGQHSGFGHRNRLLFNHFFNAFQPSQHDGDGDDPPHCP
ncbi:MAG: sigma-70 family RNA polymerase sigma factor [Proteobacteria bacterium]|nr:sigma-70 family RNA polymerase sigma factor [Pseudomonadota bacterium]